MTCEHERFARVFHIDGRRECSDCGARLEPGEPVTLEDDDD